jgi:hypothetical protein
MYRLSSGISGRLDGENFNSSLGVNITGFRILESFLLPLRIITGHLASTFSLKTSEKENV